ncbi:MAG: GNAT family N-acetyltransferase [Bacteroidetes bacterium]|nr:GNAT family N-acetyltransferase [Bacteroidota bacterium]
MFTLKQVPDQASVSDFHAVAKLVYKNDADYIQPIAKDIEEVFDRKQNAAFEGGDVIRWVLFDGNKSIGRVAAFYQSKNNGERMGGMGFFECIENQDAANLLFDACKKWLQEKGLTYMDGPVNFGDRDSFWGLLVERHSYPSYREAYQPQYYRGFFEDYGFEKIFEQKTCDITNDVFNVERFGKLAGRVLSNPRYRFVSLDYSRLDKFSADFVRIYNEAWAHHEDFKPLTIEKMMARLKKVKPVLPADFAVFAYADDRPIGFYVSILEVNQVFRHFGGKLSLLNMLRFLWLRRSINKVRGIVFGVVPDFQNLGIETGMIMTVYENLKRNPQITVAELAWIGDFNPKMLSMLASLGAYTAKVHYTYRKNF